jgi:hypothetical protein
LVLTALSGLATPLKAEYYLDTLFPIGITGINPTGASPPYGNLGLDWKWTPEESEDKNEQDLIFDLGINCIGCQDAKVTYLIDWTPNPSQSNYLHKVCIPSHQDTSIDDIYVITAGYYIMNPCAYKCDTAMFSDTVVCGDAINSPDSIALDVTPCNAYDYTWVDTVRNYGNHTASFMFRSPYRGTPCSHSHPGIGSMQFSACNEGSDYNCHGTSTDANWNTFDGDSVWRAMADKAVANFQAYFDNNLADTQYVWGYNLITEDPAVYRNTKGNPAWHGCWAGVDYLFTGHGYGTSNYNYFRGKSGLHNQSLGGIRGVEDSVDIDHRMFVAKGGPSTLHQGGYNIFEALPDLDAFLKYSHWWCKVKHNYGEQTIFDEFLYGNSPGGFSGRHNDAIYMQQYGKTNLAYPDQQRRFIAVIDVSWYEPWKSAKGNGGRRPCPPEIRCGTYLALSRGAKGIFFHGWSMGISGEYPGSTIQIPSTSAIVSANVGIRDHKGFPFGDSNSPDSEHHYLNAGCNLEYWNEHPDNTYDYLANTLIPEIKKITSKLMELDWINGYSLNSTAPEWRNPGPHYYVEDVWGVDYMDVAFFDHPYEPIGVEYFMMVNREGIADMTNRTVSVALDAQHWPEEDTLILTDIANADTPRKLTREGERYVFTEVFEPGEGKLYRVAPVNEAPVTLVPSADGGER